MSSSEWIERERARFEVATFSKADENLDWSKKHQRYTECGWRTENADVSTQMFRSWLAAKRDEVPEGWRVVPVEPTKAMENAGELVVNCFESEKTVDQNMVWEAMLNAAPGVE